MKHRHCRGRRGVAVGTPGVEGEHGTKHAEADECHREEECLPAVRDGIVLCYFKNVPSELSAFGSRVVVDTDKAEHKEGRAAHKHKGKLHCGIVLAARTPYADEEVHRYEGHFIEHEHREEVDGDEEAEHAGRQQNQPKEECFGLCHGPRGERACENDYGGENEHGHGDTVDTYCEVYVERFKPCPRVNEEHRLCGSGIAEAEVF